MQDPGMVGESSADKRLYDTARRLDEKVGYTQDLLSEKIDHLRSEIHGNDRRYKERFDAQESANKYAQEKANEFRGSLEDIGARQMPRTEAEREFRSLAEKIDSITARMDRNEGRGTMVDPMVAQLAKEVASLNLSRGEGSGEKSGRLSQQQLLFALLAAAGILFGIAMAIRT